MAREGESTLALDRATPCDVHWLPCTIRHTGEAPVSSYFLPRPAADSRDGAAAPQEAAFRGRQLRGATLPLPAGFEGFVVRKAPANAGEDAGRTWQTDGRFSKITYWNHDVPAGSSDAAQRNFEFLALSAAVHSPVTAAQVEAKLKA